MEDHINNMLDLVNKLAALGEQLMDHLIVAMMLSSLPDSYNTLISALESRAEEDLTLDLVKGKLIDDYKRRKAIGTFGESSESALKTSKESKEKVAEIKSVFSARSMDIRKRTVTRNGNKIKKKQIKQRRILIKTVANQVRFVFMLIQKERH